MRFQDEALWASRLGVNFELGTRPFVIRLIQPTSICDAKETPVHIERKACQN
jgi:hypothetical protein